MERARRDEEDVVGGDGAVLGRDRRALDQRQEVALHALAADLGAAPLGAGGNLVDLVQENDAVGLRILQRDARDVVLVHALLGLFLDEIDKIAVSDVRGGSVSREGVQRDLLPLIEGTTVATKYGPMKTDHVLFIASGAFHVSKPSDMLPELQGRLPIRVELRALTEEDFVRILTETRANLPEQYKALIGTEDVTLDIADEAITEVAKIAARVNESVENIGARRLQTVMERLVEDISFEAEEHKGETVTIDAAYVRERLDELAGDTDLSKYIL